MEQSEALRIYLTQMMDEIFVRQERNGQRASGLSANTAKVVVKQNGREGYIKAQRYLPTNFRGIGRKPGPINREGVKSIEQWLKIKHLEHLPLWAVIKSIEKKGTMVYRDNRRGIGIDGVKQKYRKEFLKNLRSSIIKSTN